MHFILICILRTIAAWRRDLRQNGGSLRVRLRVPITLSEPERVAAFLPIRSA
jgi:hypothetical protein